MIREKFNVKVYQFEEVLQRIASDTSSGVLFEKLPPSELLEKTERYVNRLMTLAASSEELTIILKPEKAYQIKSMCKNLTQTLETFKGILRQNTSDPLANSRLGFEQLRKALAEGSNILLLMREVKDNTSPLIHAILTIKEKNDTEAPAINIQSSEATQPNIKHTLDHVDEFRIDPASLEKIDETKQSIRELQEEKIKTGKDAPPKQAKATENMPKKKQLSILNFKTAKN